VTKVYSIQVFLTLTIIHKLVIHQMDVKTAFLNGVLEEEIYMTQLEGWVVPSQENKVCKLLKILCMDFPNERNKTLQFPSSPILE